MPSSLNTFHSNTYTIYPSKALNMSFFHRKNSASKESAAKEQPAKPSVRDLQARAAEKWFSEGNAEPKRKSSDFDAERARRAAAHESSSWVQMGQ